jgi:hypothetical protein
LETEITSIKARTVQTQLILENYLYYSSIYARDNGEYSGEFSPIMKMRKKQIQFLANQQIDWQAMYQANQTQF